jgi:hypothetical protein
MSVCVIATISAMYSVARGSSVGRLQPEQRAVLVHGAVKRRASALQSSPFSAARWMILSSMSVMLRT